MVDARDVEQPALVGRESETGELVGALTAGRGVVVVAGEAGVGKTRLVREVLKDPAVRPRRVLLVACPPVRQPFTLGPVVDALRSVHGRLSGLSLSPLTGALRPLLPEWGSDLPPSPEPLADASAAQHRLFRAFEELLTRLEVEHLVVEDVHWADDATLEFLLHLAAQVPQRVGVLVTYRPEDVSDGSLVRQLASRAPAGGTLTTVELQPLGMADTARLVSSMLSDAPVSEEFVTFLHGVTGGVALMLEESIRLLCDREDLVHRVDGWRRRDLAEMQAPTTVRDAVLERTARLGSDSRGLLQAFAVLGEPVDVGTGAAVAATPHTRVRDAVAEATHGGFLHYDSAGRVAFRHALVARAVYDSIAEPDRRDLHRRAARTLERAGGSTPYRLARHFREVPESEAWSQYGEQAAAAAAGAGDHRTAIEILEDLLVNCAVPPRTRARLAGKLASATLARRTGGPDLVTRLLPTLQAVAADEALTVEERADVRSKLGRVILQSAQPLDFRDELESAVPFLQDDPFEAARAMATLGCPRADRRTGAECIEWLRRAAAVRLESATRVQRLFVAVNLTSALGLLGQENEWESTCGIVPGEPDAVPAEERLITAVWFLNTGTQMMLRGRMAEADRRFRAASALAEAEGNRRLACHVVGAQCHLDWLTGRWSGLAARLESVCGSADAEPTAILEARLLHALLAGASETGAAPVGRLEGLLEEALSRGAIELVMQPSAALGRALLREGRCDDAQRATDEPVEILRAKDSWILATEIVPARVAVLTAAAVAPSSGGNARARILAQARDLVSAFRFGLGERDAPAPRAALALCEATVAETVGETEQASVSYGDAATGWESLPRPYDAVLAREAQARCRLALGQVEAGVAALSAVHDDLCRLGARPDADRVARRLREAGVDARQPSRRGRRGYGDQLSPREAEVVRLVAAGWTNRRVADTLYRSPKTVSVQLRSAMRKLGVSSRTELAFAAAESGMLEDPAGRPNK